MRPLASSWSLPSRLQYDLLASLGPEQRSGCSQFKSRVSRWPLPCPVPQYDLLASLGPDQRLETAWAGFGGGWEYITPYTHSFLLQASCLVGALGYRGWRGGG